VVIGIALLIVLIASNHFVSDQAVADTHGVAPDRVRALSSRLSREPGFLWPQFMMKKYAPSARPEKTYVENAPHPIAIAQ